VVLGGTPPLMIDDVHKLGHPLRSPRGARRTAEPGYRPDTQCP
jgi:hypothetical protein